MFVLIESNTHKKVGEAQTYEEANYDRIYHQPDHDNLIHIIEVDGVDASSVFAKTK